MCCVTKFRKNNNTADMEDLMEEHNIHLRYAESARKSLKEDQD